MVSANDQPLVRISRSNLDSLMTALDVEFVRLSECLVSRGWRLELGGPDAPGIHYNLAGTGRLSMSGHPAIDLYPHTLVVLPACAHFSIEVPPAPQRRRTIHTLNGREQKFPPDALRRYVASEDESAPDLILICGYFRATYGAGIDLFSGLTMPIVEQFDATDRLDETLKAAFAELIGQEVGMGSMTTALLKQVLVMLLRRSLRSSRLWVERFSLWSDPQIARAFAEMVRKPGSPHRVESLARTAGLSRSAFMARFSRKFGNSPMKVLRSLRMREAALLLAASSVSIDEAAQRAGYMSRASFGRAFRKLYGCDPSDYREARR
jgi:AraC family transcriptional activator of mtrCDE